MFSVESQLRGPETDGKVSAQTTTGLPSSKPKKDEKLFDPAQIAQLAFSHGMFHTGKKEPAKKGPTFEEIEAMKTTPLFVANFFHTLDGQKFLKDNPMLLRMS